MFAVCRRTKPFLCRCGREPADGMLALGDPSPNIMSKVAPKRGHMDPAIVWRHSGGDKNQHLLQRGLPCTRPTETRRRIGQHGQASGAAWVGICRAL